MDCCYRLVATIVYISLIIFDEYKMLLLTYKQIRASERSERALQKRIFSYRKNLIFLYGLLQLPLLLLLTLFTSYW